MNFSYFAGGVSTRQIIIVFVMCSRHQRQIRDLFICHVLTPSELFVNVYDVQNISLT